MSVRTCWMTDHRCPRCGSTLITNGCVVWCSFVGDQGRGTQKACTYGVDAEVALLALGEKEAAR